VNRQHDDHTWLILYGEAWKIYRLDVGIVSLWRVDPVTLRNWFATVDMGRMDWEAYVDDAVWLMQHRNELLGEAEG
jgi:hypothetical protein